MILIDPPVWPARGRVWSHLASDESYAELHAFAAGAGLHPRSYDGDHYDVPSERYDEVVAAGAQPTRARVILSRLEAAGLRFRKRSGERPLAALPNGLAHHPVPHRLDLIASTREPPEASTVATVTFTEDALGRVLLVESADRGGWEGPGGWREPGESARAAAVRETAEETGLQLHESALVPCAYERILLTGQRPDGPGHGRLLPTSHIAVYRARIQHVAQVQSHGPEGQRLRWVESQELEPMCGGAPWWPLLAAVFTDSF
ncbi:DUF4031 domain-containing protein [Gephyromycinifex aptenodytis]|uniref:DUF4031 domain-containing protein n=1 Tax=Gephyromycinifex aptenodytis TaxID=2716227 RepID=UPI001D00D006|nr:DUF4031 domain-containing protein [Gephyromycinifex aptenodytis]